MENRAKEGACLAELVQMAIPVCQQAERECPRTGPGRRPDIPDWVMAVLIIVVVLKKRKSKSSQYRFVQAHSSQLCEWLGVERLPSRSTYFDRYRRAWRLYEQAIRILGDQAVRKGFVDPRCVAVDQSVVQARGPRWNPRHRARGRIPKGADLDARWTYSDHHGWLLGYSYEVLVTAAKNGSVWPLRASAHSANTHPSRTFPEKIEQLPDGTRYVLADAGYDSNALAEAVEYDAAGRRSGRRLLCPQVYRRGEHRRPRQPRIEKGSRKRRRERRDQRREFFERPWARNLFRRRGYTVEPFNEWLKTKFELHDHVWHRGIDNNRTQLLAAIACYQLLLHYNRKRGNQHARTQWILDAL